MFLHKIVAGAADKSYGIHVAQLAGVPRERQRAGPRSAGTGSKRSIKRPTRRWRLRSELASIDALHQRPRRRSRRQLATDALRRRRASAARRNPRGQSRRTRRRSKRSTSSTPGSSGWPTNRLPRSSSAAEQSLGALAKASSAAVRWRFAMRQLNRKRIRGASDSPTPVSLLPAFMPRYNPAIIEPKWQAYWEEHQTFAAPRLPKPGTQEALRARHVPVPQRRRPARRPSGRLHRDRHRLPVPRGCRARASCTRWASTPSACRPRSTRSRRAQHPRMHDREEHRQRSAGSSRCSASATTGTASWPRPTSNTSAGRSGSSCRSYDTWFDHEQQRGRPIASCRFPPTCKQQGDDAVRTYQDEHRLAYQTEAPVNWCPALGTVLANEEVIDGKSERGGHPVVRMPLRQWMLRITAYADRLEKDLEALDWSEGIKALQRNWIGRSTGAEVDFFIGTTHRRRGKPTAANSSMADRAARAGFRASPATTCCASTPRGPTRSSARPTW